MKRTTVLLVFLAFFVSGIAQTDTLYTKARKKISCKITEIGESDLKYKLPDNLDGPVYVISINKIYKYSLSNGQVVQVTLDELLIENQHQEIMNSRTVVKIAPFSYVNNQIGIAYEHVLKTGTNLDLELGYVNNGIMPTTNANGPFVTQSGKWAAMTGVYFKPGAKFLLGQDFSLKGMKYAHPLKGRFILINAVFSYLNYQDAYFFQSQDISNSPTGPPYSTTITTNFKTADVNCFAYGAMINYGRQFILGNCITLEYYIGVGATAQSITYSHASTSSSSYVTGGSNYPGNYYRYYNSERSPNISNYHGFFRAPNVGLTATFGFRMGFILPEGKDAKKSSAAEAAARQRP
jgi:hypothetical protein